VLELFGPSSAGKSSLAARLVAGGSVVHAQDRLLGRCGLAWLRGRLLRTLAVDSIAALGVLVTWRAGSAYYVFAAKQVLRMSPASVPLRLNLLRNAWKAAALRLLAPRLATPGECLLMDEGPLQAANYLLVNAHAAPDAAALEAFLRVVPLPDAAAYVRAPEQELVSRTLQRTHPRIPDGSRDATERFVMHALRVFDRVAEEPSVKARLCAPEAWA